MENLVETAKGYARHERTALERVTAQRARAVSALDRGDVAATRAAEGALGGGLRGLLGLAESYPGLKADAHFRDLQNALIQLEDDLQNARRYYNAVVRDLNIRVQSFPDILLARPLGFRTRDYFELESALEGLAPAVRFDPAGGTAEAGGADDRTDMGRSGP